MTAQVDGAPVAAPQDESVVIADGRLVLMPKGVEQRVDVSLARTAELWRRGQQALQRALERRDRPHLKPCLHRFYRTASDALVFVCHVDSDGDAKCHVMTADADNTFRMVERGQNYWVYRRGAVSSKLAVEATSGDWLMEELPWKVVGLPAPNAAGASALNGLEWMQPGRPHQSAQLTEGGLWITHNGSTVAVSARSDGTWGATVANGGHALPDLVGTAPGSLYRVNQGGAVVWTGDDKHTNNLGILAAISGMALFQPAVVQDVEGNVVHLIGDEPALATGRIPLGVA